ncbi:MAG: DUF3604 domain-containing protein [Roseibium sp.]|uniref:DUF3604 domain-containing protein n=1 Tax=Roseibium sp. TaxID=1936156 RepID=UPI00260CED37|nr:DUF3604 domain-containing protein [Roseibium sp.]MCV0424183.1 DUF3604 domain-containing protein [Roseibium sp.]
MPYNDYRPDLMGTATLEPRGPFEVRSWQSLTLVYTAGLFGIDDQGSVKIGMRGHFDGSPLQTTEPTQPGYVTAEASNGAPLEVSIETRRNIRPWNKSIFIRCLRYLKEGDTITLRLGDKRNGSPGLQLQTFCESKLTFQVLVDAYATYDYVPLAEARTPYVSVVPTVPAVWKIVAPTLRRPGEPFRISIKAEDVWGNPSDKIDQTIRLSATGRVDGLPENVTFLPGEFVQIAERLKVEEEGTYTIRAHDERGNLLAMSNPIVIKPCSFAHFWSDMHGQSGETIGINTAREYFDFARNKSFLDICGHQGNDFQITDAFWQELNCLTAEFNEDDRFLAVPGYEWSGNTGTGGDHNVWYRGEGRPIYRSSRALIADRTRTDKDAHRLPDLFDRLEGEDAIVVAHVGGRHADVKYAFEAKLEPSVEIHSAWGTFEWILKDAIEMGYRVGIVGSSDGHKGRPGASYPGDSSFGSYGGLTCHLLPRLNRDALFAEFRKRHHYATTGARIFLDVAGQFDNGCRVLQPDSSTSPATQCLMGDVVETGNESMRLALRVEGSAPIERVEIFDATELIRTYRTWEQRELGNRIRVTVAGQRYRGRGRLVRWQGKLRLSGGEIERYAAVNFWNHNEQPKQVSDSEIIWTAVTTGGEAAIDIWVDAAAMEGDVIIDTNFEGGRFAMRSLDADGETVNCGGMDIRFNVKRLPEILKTCSFDQCVELPLSRKKENKFFVKVTQEDGHKAWSSPIYVSSSSQGDVR